MILFGTESPVRSERVVDFRGARVEVGMYRHAAFMLGMLASPAPDASAGEARFYLSPHYVASHFTGNARLSREFVSTRFDFEETLGVDPSEPTAEVDGFVRFRRYRLEFGYTRGEVSGDSVLEKDLVIEGADYFAGTHLFTDIESSRGRLLLGYDFLDGKRVTLGPVVGIQRLQFEGRFKFRCCSSPQIEELRYLQPAVGGSLGVHPATGLAIHLRASGLVRNRLRLVDSSIVVEYLIARRFGISAGYSYYHFNHTDPRRQEGTQDDDHLKILQHGWFGGLSLHL